jgi:hypothetical protein
LSDYLEWKAADEAMISTSGKRASGGAMARGSSAIGAKLTNTPDWEAAAYRA